MSYHIWIIKVRNETQKWIEFMMIEGRGDDYKGLEIYAKTSKHN